MNCGRCGYQNVLNADFCANCGTRIEKVMQIEVKEKKKNVFSKVLIFLFVLVLLSGGGYFGFRYYQVDSLQKKAQACISLGDYEGAIKIYDAIIQQTGKVQHIEEKKQIEQLMASDKAFVEGQKAAEKGDTIAAIENLSNVIEQDEKNYEVAKKKMAEIGKQYLSLVNQEVENNNYDRAIELINTYLKALPESETAMKLKSSILQKKEVYEKAEQEREAEEQRIRELIDTASNLIGTTQTVVTVEANVRSAPRKGKNIVDVIKQGTEVYIIDTKVEDNEIIWCKVRYDDFYYFGYKEGWISYKTMNYEI